MYNEKKRKEERKLKKYGLKAEKTVIPSKMRKKKKRERETHILWISRHKLSREQKLSLSRIYGNYRITQHAKTVNNYREIIDLAKNCDIIAVNVSLDIKRDLIANVDDKPIIQSTSRRISGLSGYTNTVVYNGWEQILYVSYKTKKLTHYHKTTENPLRIYFLGHKALTLEQELELKSIYGTDLELVQCLDRTKDREQVAKIVSDFDIAIMDHNLSVVRHLLKVTDKPILHPQYIRLDTDRLAYNDYTGRMEPEIINIPNGFNIIKELDYATKKL